jgi:hypothetical protein
MAADCKSAAPCELRRFESSPVHHLVEAVCGREAERGEAGSPQPKIPSESEGSSFVNRLAIAFSVYVILGVLAWSTLGDSRIRLVTLAILALFAAKTLLHRKDAMHGRDE